MRTLFLVLAALMGLAAGAVGRPAAAADSVLAPADRAAIEGTIRGQMEAFRRDDAAAAFAFAAPGIQAMFGTPENFLRMVRAGYQAVYRPREVEFRTLDVIADVVVQQVLVVSPEGRTLIALYTMERMPGEKAGGEAWRIGGCTLVEAPEKAI